MRRPAGMDQFRLADLTIRVGLELVEGNLDVELDAGGGEILGGALHSVALLDVLVGLAALAGLPTTELSG